MREAIFKTFIMPSIMFIIEKSSINNKLVTTAELENKNMTIIVKKVTRLYLPENHVNPIDKKRIVYKAKNLIEELELLAN